ncbi:MAG: hypothetical protein ACR2O8_07535 [Rhizobiaceae bacterium]
MEERLERRDTDIKNLRSKSGDSGKGLQAALKENDQLQAQNIKLESEVAQVTLRMEALLKDASGENIENAVATFESERQALTTKLAETEAELDDLKAEVSSLLLASGDDWEAERRENAVMRERINDLAAKVTSMTAALEGPDSPINKAVAKSRTATRNKSAAKKKAAEKPTNLAERIQALQDVVEKA